MFSDPRFIALELEHVRVVTPYDVACDPGKHRYYLDVYLAEAARVGARPLVAFSYSWRKRLRWKVPTYRRFLRCFRDFRARYPQVRDWNNLGRWFERYRPHLRGRPRLWSIHNYGDVNRARRWRQTGTFALLRRTRGRLWMTETGGIVHSRHGWSRNEGRAARATRNMFAVAQRSRRITRVYAYQWQG